MTEYLDRMPTMHEYAEGKRINPNLTDLISRADAMAELREWVKRANENGETPTWNDAVSLIGSLPSADAVQGEWNKVEIKYDMWTCSVCGSPLMTDDIEETHFCPNCGARMKGGEEE